AAPPTARPRRRRRRRISTPTSPDQASGTGVTDRAVGRAGPLPRCNRRPATSRARFGWHLASIEEGGQSRGDVGAVVVADRCGGLGARRQGLGGAALDG